MAAATILIVDDVPDLRLLLRTIIEQEQGLEVVAEAKNGAEAVTLVESLHPDIVVMDLMMPVMDGVEATRRIAHRFHDVRVVAYTSLDDDSTRNRMLAAGAFAQVAKPDMAGLLDAIRRAAEADPLGGLPDDLEAVLKADPQARSAFERLSEEHQSECLLVLQAARTLEQRRHRIELIVSTLG